MTLPLRFKLEVEQGLVHVNSICVANATPDVLLLLVDCREKYADVDGHSIGPGLCHVAYIMPSTRTYAVTPGLLNQRPDNPRTEIRVLGLRGGWLMASTSDRYWITILLARDRWRKSPGQRVLRKLSWDDGAP